VHPTDNVALVFTAIHCIRCVLFSQL